MVDHAIVELNELVPHARLDLIRVPGAFEIPVAVATVLEREAPAAILALGLIMRGATQHGDLVARAVTDALMQLSVQYGLPVIHEVVIVDTEQQAHDRCIGPTLNRGREAARAAAAMVDVFQELDRSMPRPSANSRLRSR
jgi:6,7-dimethyl-8-ribityllumazine synthase